MIQWGALHITMDNEEARSLLREELAKYRGMRYEELRALVNAPKRVSEVVGPSGTHYYIDVYAAWEGWRNGDVRVMGRIDDGAWRAFVPLAEGFVRTPTGDTFQA